MSGAFSGFSEEDIKKLQNGTTGNTPSNDPVTKQVKLALKGRKVLRPIVRFDESRNKTSTLTEVIVPEEAKLCKDEKSDLPEISEKDSVANEEQVESVTVNSNGHIEAEAPDLRRKPVNVDELQAKQKLMEEQNRRRKELLTRALADKKKRTQEEAQRLNEIQNEFKKLDARLSNDVKLLRKKIELASIDYMEAHKRYVKIEKEFLDTKLALQQKLEKKELLTEHLCTIIEQNEERKAEKLTELLNKLELSDIDNKVIEMEKANNEATALH